MEKMTWRATKVERPMMALYKDRLFVDHEKVDKGGNRGGVGAHGYQQQYRAYRTDSFSCETEQLSFRRYVRGFSDGQLIVSREEDYINRTTVVDEYPSNSKVGNHDSDDKGIIVRL